MNLGLKILITTHKKMFAQDQSQVILTPNTSEALSSVNNITFKNVRQGPSNVSFFEKTADSISSSSVSFKIPVSGNNIISRRVILELPVRVTHSADTHQTREFFICPRADAINRIISSCSVKVNGGGINSRPSDYAEYLPYYYRSHDDYNVGLLSECSNEIDYRYGNNVPAFQATTENPGLVRYHWQDASLSPTIPQSRGALPFTKAGAAAHGAANGAAGAVTFDFVLRYALKNPVFNGNADDTLANVEDLEVQVQFDTGNALANAFYTSTIVRSLDGANASAGVTTLATSVVLSEVKLIGKMIEPSENMRDMIPEILTVPSQEYTLSPHPIADMLDGASQTIVHPSFRVSQVPSAIFMRVTNSRAGKSQFRSDFTLPLTNIQLKVNDRSMEYVQVTQRELYLMCVRNGLNMRYVDFLMQEAGFYLSSGASAGFESKGTGAPLCFVPSRDLSGELKENLMENFKFDAKFTVTNSTGNDLTDLQSEILFVHDNTLIIQRGKQILTINGVTLDEYAMAKAGDQQTVMSTSEDPADVSGSGFFSAFHNGAKKGFGGIVDPASKALGLIPLGPAQAGSRALGNINGLVQGSGMSNVDQMRGRGLLLS